MTLPTEADLVGTVRAGFPREPGTVLVKTGNNIWTVVGGPHSGRHTFPNARVVAAEHAVLGMLPGLETGPYAVGDLVDRIAYEHGSTVVSWHGVVIGVLGDRLEAVVTQPVDIDLPVKRGDRITFPLLSSFSGAPCWRPTTEPPVTAAELAGLGGKPCPA